MNPLAIVQARIGSTRLPRKMLLDLGGKPLIWWAWKAAVDAFSVDNVVTAIPATSENDELATVVRGFAPWLTTGAEVFRWDGPENDVLGRFHACAHRYRWQPDSVIVRVTPDDPFKVPALMKRVAEGERHPVELGGEAFTLEMLDETWGANLAIDLTFEGNSARQAYEAEHLTDALAWLNGSEPPPPAPPGVWTIDTEEDLNAAREIVARRLAIPYPDTGDAPYEGAAPYRIRW